MATYTEHYNLKKPDLNDIANIGDINDNMDIIDDEMSKLIDSVPTMSGASASTDGESGVVPQPVAGDNAKYLRGDATYSVPGVMTINGRTPDPVTGDITVIEGGGSGSYGSYRLDATIPVSAWSGSGPYTTTITNEYIKSTMDGSETWPDNEAEMLGETTFTTRDGSLLVSTTVKPTAQWVLHVALALNGADVLADMSASIANVADGLAILATGDTHAQIAKGQFVYVRNHGTANGFSGTAVLADGLYVATAAINANGSLTISNLAADGAGGLNALKADYDTLNSKTYSLPLAASGTRGGVQIGYAENGKNYPVKLSGEKMYVNVPWSNTTYSAGTGLSLSSTTFSAKLSNSLTTTDATTALTLTGAKALNDKFAAIEDAWTGQGIFKNTIAILSKRYTSLGMAFIMGNVNVGSVQSSSGYPAGTQYTVAYCASLKNSDVYGLGAFAANGNADVKVMFDHGYIKFATINNAFPDIIWFSGCIPV